MSSLVFLRLDVEALSQGVPDLSAGLPDCLAGLTSLRTVELSLHDGDVFEDLISKLPSSLREVRFHIDSLHPDVVGKLSHLATLLKIKERDWGYRHMPCIEVVGLDGKEDQSSVLRWYSLPLDLSLICVERGIRIESRMWERCE